MSVESLDEGCPLITNVTSPGFVVLVVSVHVVHQPSEPTALFIAELTDAEGLDTRGYFLLGCLTHPSGFGSLADPADGSPTLSHLCSWRRRGWSDLLAAGGTGPSSLVSRLSWGQSVVARTVPGHNPPERLPDLNITGLSQCYNSSPSLPLKAHVFRWFFMA